MFKMPFFLGVQIQLPWHKIPFWIFHILHLIFTATTDMGIDIYSHYTNKKTEAIEIVSSG